VLQERLTETTRLNDQLTTENKKLQILAGRSSSSTTLKSSQTSPQAAGKADDDSVTIC